MVVHRVVVVQEGRFNKEVPRKPNEKVYFSIKLTLMSKEEIKEEISKVLDRFSDHALNELLGFLKGLEHSNHSLSFENHDFQKILSEDHDLLQKLAQ